jgi:hypothetical protein
MLMWGISIVTGVPSSGGLVESEHEVAELPMRTASINTLNRPVITLLSRIHTGKV